jgi:hypothetical protein
MAQLFDVVYTPVQVAGYPEPYTTVMARRLGAIDRMHAILWWLRTELGVVIDPVTMFDNPAYDLNGYGDYKIACGCELRVRFRMHTLGRFERMRRGVEAIPVVDVSAEPCELHDVHGDPREGRNWNGFLRAWKHDPKLPDSFKQGE